MSCRYEKTYYVRNICVIDSVKGGLYHISILNILILKEKDGDQNEGSCH